jgi:hypothetical protein
VVAGTVSIEIYTGQQGCGKTYNMVAEVILPSLRIPSFEVLSNLDVVDPKSGRRTEPIDLTHGFDGIKAHLERNLSRPLEERKSVVLCVDELGVTMPVELWKSDAAMDVIAISLQMRKARCDFVGTVQHFERVVKVLRDNATVVHKCRLKYRHPWKRDLSGPINRRNGKPYMRAWWFEIESVTPEVINLSEQRRKAGRIGGFRQVFFRDEIAGCFDTFARVEATGLLDDGKTIEKRRKAGALAGIDWSAAGPGSAAAFLDELDDLATERAQEAAVSAVEAEREDHPRRGRWGA